MEVPIDFVPNVLYVSLNYQTLQSSFVLTNRDSLIHHIDYRLPFEESFPYAFFLNQYLTCEFFCLDKIVAEMTADMSGSTSSQDILAALNKLSKQTDNLYLIYCISVMWQKYVRFKNDVDISVETKNAYIKIYYDLLKINNYSLLDIFSAYDLMPYYKINNKKRNQILEDSEWGIRDWQISNQIYSSITPMIKYYITSMKSDKLYLQICENNECGKLFVTTNKRKSKFCKGAYCELDGEDCSDKASRHKNKVARCEYLKVYEKTLNYFNQRVKRNNYPADSRDSFKQEARENKKKVENKEMSEEAFIKWLDDKRNDAIERLKESKEI